MSELSARERIILAVDTSRREDAERLAAVAKQAGARFIKMGLELSSAESWQYCSQLAERHGLDWVADAKLNDISNTLTGMKEISEKTTPEKTVFNIAHLPHPPVGITIHTTSSRQALQRSQKVAGDVKMLGVTLLTDITDAECYADHRFTINADTYPPTEEGMAAFRRDLVMSRAQKAARVGLAGVVSSPQEVGLIRANPETQGLFAMIPGTRSVGAEHGDQGRVGTPATAIQDGADLLVIGRQITQAPDPAVAFEAVVAEIGAVL